MFFASLQPFLLPHFETRVSLTGCGEAAFLLTLHQTLPILIDRQIIVDLCNWDCLLRA